MIKAIIFDLGNVIVNIDRSNLYKEWAEKSNRGAKDVIDFYSNSKAIRKFEKGRLSPKEFYRKARNELGLRMGFREFKISYCNIFSLNREVADEIRKLKKHYRLVLLSNTDRLNFEYIKNKFRIVDVFDDYVLSYKTGMRKPNPLIFVEAVRKCRASPFSCMYFDDIPEFVMVARLVGIKAYVFSDFKKLIGDLGRNNLP